MGVFYGQVYWSVYSPPPEKPTCPFKIDSGQIIPRPHRTDLPQMVGLVREISENFREIR